MLPRQLEGEIEIDESLFGRRVKYHRGNPHVGVKIWIFGMVERATNRLIMYPVSDRTEKTLVQIIQRHVKRGSTIYSDGWSAYCNLNEYGYKHFTVIHKYAFKKIYMNTETNQEVAVHTNRIEGAWKHAKDHFKRMAGTKGPQFESHLAEVMWRLEVKDKIYPEFFKLVREVYNLEGPQIFTRKYPLFDSWSGAPSDILPDETDVETDSSSAASSSDEGAVAEPQRTITELLSHTNLTSDDEDDNDINKTLTEEQPVVRPKRITAKRGKAKQQPIKSRGAKEKQQPRSLTDNVWHPRGYVEQRPDRPRRRQKKSIGNTYSKAGYEWGDSSDDSF